MSYDTLSGGKPEYIDVPLPQIGGKAWLMDRPGIFVLETGEGTMRTLACTHFGAGNIAIYDGIPNDEGYFQDIPEDDPAYPMRNGRPFYRANPAVLGSWMLDAGFIHGLTIEVTGGHEGISPIGTIVWMPRSRPRS